MRTPVALPLRKADFGVVAGLLLTLFSLAHGAPETARINGQPVATKVVGGHTYVEMEAFKAALGLDSDQTLAGATRLFGAPPATKEVVVEFSPDSPQVQVNDETATLAAPVVNGPAGLLVPLDDFVTLFGAPTEAVGEPPLPEPSPRGSEAPTAVATVDAGLALVDVGAIREGAVTVVRLKFNGRPDYRFLFDPDTATLQVVLEKTQRVWPRTQLDVKTSEVSQVTLEAFPDQDHLVASLHLVQEVTYDSSFDDATKTVVLRLHGPGNSEGPTIASPTKATQDMQSYLANHPVVLDPGHGGDDPGVDPGDGRTEATVTLDFCLRLKPILEKGGFRVVLTRNSPATLGVLERLVLINQTRPGVAISVHANASYDPEQTGPVLLHLPPPAAATLEDPILAARGIHGPSPMETSLASDLARRLAEAFSKTVGRRAELAGETALLPARRVFAPCLSLELGYLTSAADRAALADARLVDRLAYTIYSVLHDHMRERWTREGGKGAAIEKLPAGSLPPAERPGAAPAKATSPLGEPKIRPPETADELDEPLTGEDSENTDPLPGDGGIAGPKGDKPASAVRAPAVPAGFSDQAPLAAQAPPEVDEIDEARATPTSSLRPPLNPPPLPRPKVVATPTPARPPAAREDSPETPVPPASGTPAAPSPAVDDPEDYEDDEAAPVRPVRPVQPVRPAPPTTRSEPLPEPVAPRRTP